ncbi:MAG: YkgJ family cysteine cluster protein [Deltaproteobacteria bacterium]
MGRASKRKKSGPNRPGAGRASGSRPTARVNPSIAGLARDNVVAIVNQGRGLERALEIATSAFFLAEHLTRRFEAENPLPQPLACGEGCDACCHNLVELTPPEALLIGHHLSRHLSEAEKDRVFSQVARNLSLVAGQSEGALAKARQNLPCPLLRGRVCIAYPIRPLVCRAMHGLSRERCEAELRSGSLAGSQYYPHRHEIAVSVSAGILEGCRASGCQAGTLELARALHDFFREDHAVERWIAGEAVFRSTK